MLRRNLIQKNPKLTTASDEQLIASTLEGNISSFGAIVEKNGHKVWVKERLKKTVHYGDDRQVTQTIDQSSNASS